MAGLGLLPVRVTFGADKMLARPSGTGYGAEVHGYEIHHGVAEVAEGRAEPFPGGCRTVAVWGTTWHGTLECDQFRRAFLTEVAALAGRDFTVAPDTSFAAAQQARLDTLADLVAGHLDTAAVSRLIEDGHRPGCPWSPRRGSREFRSRRVSVDPESGIGFAYVMNRMGASMVDDPRKMALLDAVYASLSGVR